MIDKDKLINSLKDRNSLQSLAVSKFIIKLVDEIEKGNFDDFASQDILYRNKKE